MKDDWTRLEQLRERDRARLERTARKAAGESAADPYHFPDSTVHKVICEECGGRVVYMREEYTCEECGLVQR